MTRFNLSTGMIQVTDWLPVEEQVDIALDSLPMKDREAFFSPEGGGASQTKPIPWLVRRVEALRGHGRVEIEVKPAFDYARAAHSLERHGPSVHLLSNTQHLELISLPPIEWEEAGGMLHKTLKLVEEDGNDIFLVLRNLQPATAASLNKPCLLRSLGATISYWHRWLQNCNYAGRWREAVERSCLALKLLCFEPTGAIVAAPTCSLPEVLGGGANWDYRFVWIRDAAFTVYALLRVGLKAEAAAFMKWVEALLSKLDREEQGRLRVMYDIHGDEQRREDCPPLQEAELPHLAGYGGSQPVRIGNAAEAQTQLDIYGELMDAIYLIDKHVETLSHVTWKRIIRHLVEPVMREWRNPDHGLWESRRAPAQHLYSKVMAWVTLDRAIRLVNKHAYPGPVEQWRHERDLIHQTIMAHQPYPHFTQLLSHEAVDSQAMGAMEVLDASNLILPMVFFCPATDPRFLATLRAILRKPSAGGLTLNHLVFRYYEEGEEATFTLCTFWLVEAMARAGGHWLREARIMFEEVLGHANHLGLFGEQLTVEGRSLGNFPQAFTHLSLISAAFNLNRRLP